jgi:VIT1/CCC1 family predicted Fe2+/Mn2+ transporter
MPHREFHRVPKIGWLRASVLGANDGLISTSSLVIGIAAAQAGKEPLLLAALAGLVAGALSMAAGEYVSVSSQADSEAADLARERHELAADPVAEHEELTRIYRARGLNHALADQVARALAAHDVLAAHARDELGITEMSKARPLQAALASAGAFASGALLPVLMILLMPLPRLMTGIAAATLAMLLLLGALAAKLGGAPLLPGALRVGFWGVAAMAATAVVGRLFGTAI